MRQADYFGGDMEAKGQNHEGKMIGGKTRSR